MELGAVLLLLGLMLLVGLFVYEPFLRRESRGVSQEEHDLSVLQAEQERILGALNELDMDHALGKVPEEDYPQQRAALVQAGVEVMRRMDALQARESVDMEERLEAAIAERRRQAESDGQDDELEALIANRRAQRREKSKGFCPQCGRPVLESDLFCPHCGHRLK